MICRKPGCLCPLSKDEECCPDCLTPNPEYRKPKKKILKTKCPECKQEATLIYNYGDKGNCSKCGKLIHCKNMIFVWEEN